MSPSRQSLQAHYLTKDINYFLDDLTHLRMRYEYGELATLPLIYFKLFPSGSAQGFVITHTKTTQQNVATIEYCGSIASINVQTVTAFSFEDMDAFSHYFFPIPLTLIDKTVSKLELTKTVAKMEQALTKAGINTKINLDKSIAVDGQQYWLYNQLITDVCMSFVEAAQQPVAKESLIENAQKISIRIGENLSMKNTDQTLEISVPLLQTMSARSQRAMLIETLFETL